MNQQGPPSALDALPAIRQRLLQHSLAFFLDFDGTLAPIVSRPEAAEITEDALRALELLADLYPVCVVSGRSLDSLQSKVGLGTLYYAADHGHRIVGPTPSAEVDLGAGVDFEAGLDDASELLEVTRKLERALAETHGVLLEPKEVSVAVHYRAVAAEERGRVRDAVHEVLKESPGLRLMEGKMVYEILPDIAWGKGQAVLWLLDHLPPTPNEVRVPICIGDDVTDEDMFIAVKGQGVSAVVGELNRATHADYRLRDVSEVVGFLRLFADPSIRGGLDVV